MNYIGIDISKYKHDIFIMSDLGETINAGFAFTNTAEGFSTLLAELEKHKEYGVCIGFEATGNYGINLKNFLLKHDYEYVEINAKLVQEFKKGKTLRRTKTDKLDAKLIAEYLLERKIKPIHTLSYQKFALKQLTRLRSSLVTQRSRYLIQLTNILDCIFPEFKPFFGGKFSATALFILANYPSPKSIANMNSRSFEILRKKSRGKFTMDKFVQLKELAKNTVGLFDMCYAVQLEVVLDLYSQLDSKISVVEDQIAAIVMEINPPTLSIKGIGPVSAAVIISEIEDISRFKTPDKLLAFAGLDCAISQSGTTEHFGHMVKRGSSSLRNTLMQCANTVSLYNEVFAAYYHKKIAEGKPHYTAMNHVAKKLVRLIFALESKGVFFDETLLR